jgi:hypothetical protein
MRTILLGIVFFGLCGNPARSETLDIHQAMRLAGKYLSMSNMAKAFAAVCRTVPPAVAVGKEGTVFRWRGETDIEWMDKQAIDYGVLAGVLVEKVKHAVPARAAEAETSFQQMVSDGGAETIHQRLASIPPPDALPMFCWGLRTSLEVGLPPRISVSDTTVAPE